VIGDRPVIPDLIACQFGKRCYVFRHPLLHRRRGRKSGNRKVLSLNRRLIAPGDVSGSKHMVRHVQWIAGLCENPVPQPKLNASRLVPYFRRRLRDGGATFGGIFRRCVCKAAFPRGEVRFGRGRFCCSRTHTVSSQGFSGRSSGNEAQCMASAAHSFPSTWVGRPIRLSSGHTLECAAGIRDFDS